MREIKKHNFSIIIPVYNKEMYIEECVLSVLNQEYDNFEIIVVDDCSTDNSLEICQLLCEKSKKVVVLKNSINSGVSFSRNRGLEKANGDFVIFLDGDDRFISMQLLSVLFRQIEKHDFDYMILSRNYFNKKIVPNSKKVINETIMFGEGIYGINDKEKFIQKIGLPFGGSASACVSSKLIDNTRFNINEYHYEDWAFFIPLYFKSTRTFILNAPMTYINYVEDSLSKKKRIVQRYSLPNIYQFLKDNNYNKLRKQVFWYWMASNQANVKLVDNSKEYKKEVHRLMIDNFIVNKYSIYSILIQFKKFFLN